MDAGANQEWMLISWAEFWQICFFLVLTVPVLVAYVVKRRRERKDEWFRKNRISEIINRRNRR